MLLPLFFICRSFTDGTFIFKGFFSDIAEVEGVIVLTYFDLAASFLSSFWSCYLKSFTVIILEGLLSSISLLSFFFLISLFFETDFSYFVLFCTSIFLSIIGSEILTLLLLVRFSSAGSGLLTLLPLVRFSSN